MRITLLVIGKTNAQWLNSGIGIYTKRLLHYTRFEQVEIITPKHFKQLNSQQLKEAEGKLLLKYLEEADQVILLDERGKNYTSEDFADWLQKMMNAGTRHLVFAVGGAYGFSDEVYAAASGKLSLSAMTFSHQMVRLFFAEQLYRAFTILRNEPYHNS
ncbi:MAG: 23S rRNA (pseudouridine(1915)-N(3))-methyltransferase RlmH [Lentimicrobium sp.]|nr:23S rRNA (pseudouridine(1915)-N(3))-methyltransferase RlmH [Lentimicrobium sp.]